MTLKVVMSIAAVLLVACSNTVSDGSQSDEATCEEIRSTKNDFVPIEDVLACVQENEKVAFVIRHGERNAGESGYDDTLNANGAEQARELGRRLKDYSDFYFMHTDYLRTLETGYRIAEGKGQKVEEFTRDNCDSIVHEWNDDLRYDWYLKDGSYMSMCASGNNMAAYTKMAYEVDDYYCDLAFYNAKERTMEFVRNHFTYGQMHDITFAVTHDLFVAPLMISITDGEIGMDYYKYGDEYYWPNFLAGAAIIVDDKDNVTMIPVKGLSSGRMADQPLPDLPNVTSLCL